MKEILKTLSPERLLKCDKVFNSPENKRIREQLVPELFRRLRPKFNPSYNQLKEWLRVLHKHRRDTYLLSQKGSQNQANRRVHTNNRLNSVWNLLYESILTL